MNIAVIDYQGGNVQSVLFALERLGMNATLTSDPEVIRRADRVLFPGEGEASSAMRALRAAGLDKVLPTLTQPFLGICLGMQLLGRHSEEGPAGGTELLGMLPFDVVRFTPPDAAHKVPHMGWNNLHDLQTPLFENLGGGGAGPPAAVPTAADYVYFVHSFYAPVGDYTIAQASYPAGAPFSAGVRYRNFYGVQFHVEKSGPAGEQILKNFLVADLT
ncbi:imidazole glycerol phosphate synthase subunit HisH [Hymenobacter sp. UV11]|uniref:imidazole glycerol phosphate synthase subunit HisH n=1 Tax=Hymenobacter sp. UV11 TaxID=1849735 RepID=UPI00105BBEEC|nr:imidazole glycerol phosphate synthase subunit HisH [Hymenobacter sp. UV11]TDN39239.1 imidazole glycerol phosphate synthase, glutamine amidotransferase subunit [Hymenobacter sp. UV11]TFZ65682.1 imidazole glycerol phosphate synthase subunit HisH [Hymenobacter sp. UV11]